MTPDLIQEPDTSTNIKEESVAEVFNVEPVNYTTLNDMEQTFIPEMKNDPFQKEITSLQHQLQQSTLERDAALRKVEMLSASIEELLVKRQQAELTAFDALEKLKLSKSMLHQLNQDKEMILYYTGLSSFDLLSDIFYALHPALHHDPRFKISLKEQFILTLMKLRLNLGNKDFAYRFDIHRTTVKRYIEKFIDVMYVRLPPALLLLPDSKASKLTMPLSFRKHYPNCIAILDCFKINCEMHSNIIDKASCYSKYKSHHTAKYMVSMTPQGSINFCSKGFVGRSTDVEIVKQSGFVKYVREGDQVMANHGFLIGEEIEALGATLVTPAFKGLRPQLEGSETEFSRIVSNERIHIERGIGNLRKKYTILRGPIKIPEMNIDFNRNAFIDKIVVVCYCLMNAMPSMIPPW
ncbi:uncharacterized protein LOC123477468 [Daphnia magna]|uniref:uncharacterized protein LOC123477468 n=1 Tax=Daphnia magna TaxID=35525 RepID=UPI001E1BCEBD|nr:uncharacterized protein LOC123477468 [Daphnia magna]